ncbi:MAG: MerR family transcriptional regulator [Deltaproteobacteria bacterium]|mgnify:CR=1 FL=1|jgi:DNA-binding transcriptional MerR regulator|nr:MerR family transcriptional regulator [Deltaproteobacteria bacterium]MBT4638095.1 MerR family transcriptional regulator [Deltaproteobacteria bacterium]MBT6500005.1 MerR family transcriptional regulator [Deltaproteobacteria bacterium]MBT7154752.1 MerR family transcriptional regulator [Deltaproteobacteria bacterium]MBT7714244.1 MerR family transcriptional regulator [Deltaproteobacteria bacterium]
MKISELVKSTGVSKETIHYYIREGLLRKPRKTGRNVAQYGEEYVEQIRTIKALQDNHYLPLSVIKKVLKKNRTAAPEQRASLGIITEHFRPIDRLLGEDNLEGTAAFLQATGLSENWLQRLVDWEIITPTEEADIVTFSSLDITLGKLITTMDRLGFGPKDGTDPENLKKSFDFVAKSLHKDTRELMMKKSREMSLDDFMEKSSQITEVMGLFLYYTYQKISTAEFKAYSNLIEEQ